MPIEAPIPSGPPPQPPIRKSTLPARVLPQPTVQPPQQVVPSQQIQPVVSLMSAPVPTSIPAPDLQPVPVCSITQVPVTTPTAQPVVSTFPKPQPIPTCQPVAPRHVLPQPPLQPQGQPQLKPTVPGVSQAQLRPPIQPPIQPTLQPQLPPPTRPPATTMVPSVIRPPPAQVVPTTWQPPQSQLAPSAYQPSLRPQHIVSPSKPQQPIMTPVPSRSVLPTSVPTVPEEPARLLPVLPQSKQSKPPTVKIDIEPPTGRALPSVPPKKHSIPMAHDDNVIQRRMLPVIKNSKVMKQPKKSAEGNVLLKSASLETESSHISPPHLVPSRTQPAIGAYEAYYGPAMMDWSSTGEIAQSMSDLMATHGSPPTRRRLLPNLAETVGRRKMPKLPAPRPKTVGPFHAKVPESFAVPMDDIGELDKNKPPRLLPSPTTVTRINQQNQQQQQLLMSQQVNTSRLLPMLPVNNQNKLPNTAANGGRKLPDVAKLQELKLRKQVGQREQTVPMMIRPQATVVSNNGYNNGNHHRPSNGTIVRLQNNSESESDDDHDWF